MTRLFDALSRNIGLIFLAVFICLSLTVFTGCTAISSGTIDFEEQGVRITNNPDKSVSISDDGSNLIGVFSGPAPTNTKMDDAGLWTITPGELEQAFFDLGDGKRAFLNSPSDLNMRAAKITYNSDPATSGTVIVIEGFAMDRDISTVAEVRVSMFDRGMRAIEGLTEDQAAARLAEMEAAGDITANVTRAVLTAAFPTP